MASSETGFFGFLPLFPEGNLRLTAGRPRDFFVFLLFLRLRFCRQNALLEEHLLESFWHGGFDVVSLPRQRIRESELICMQAKAFDGVSRFSVFIVPDDVMAFCPELNANLVLPAGIKSDI